MIEYKYKLATTPLLAQIDKVEGDEEKDRKHAEFPIKEGTRYRPEIISVARPTTQPHPTSN